ncbi:leucine-rich repeat domain-containing protein [Halosquirtibacter xylanolyticus]|uniref:leucine-rich repeat domain-containing protein n=1 Tax=Halosquirtibacter xylanolyticus TaxID=3374599 RepID=UPI003749AEEE|nr:leucine-rich repeat domain-containing protein [Prolixibacteraceae bacterium]
MNCQIFSIRILANHLLTLIILLTSSLLSAQDLSKTQTDWEFSEVTIDGINGISLNLYKGKGTHVRVPKSIDGKNIIALCYKKGGSAGLFGQKNTSPNTRVRSFEAHDNGILVIGSSTFNNCNNISFSVQLPNSVKVIERYAFVGSKISSFTFPSSLTTLGDHAFAYCEELSWVSSIPDSVDEIKSETFFECKNLHVNFSDLVSPHIKKVGSRAFSGCGNLVGKFHLTEVTHIGYFAFEECSGLSGNLVLPNTLIELEYSAFNKCSGLNGTLTLPVNITKISTGLFSGCTNLNGDVTIPSRVTAIGNSAFLNCSGLNGTLTLPMNLKSIGDAAFRNTNFTGELQIPNNLSDIGRFTFYDCKNFQPGSLMPENIYTIPEECFRNSSAYRQNLIIPDKIDFIDYFAFNGDPADGAREIKSITLPENFYEISERSFIGTTKQLKRITISAEMPPIVKMWVDKRFNILRRKTPDEIIVFDDEAYDNATLFVPKGFVDVYRAAPLWSRFTKIKEIIPTAVDLSLITKPYQVITSRHGIRIIDTSKIKEIRFYDIQGRLIHIDNGNSTFVTTKSYQNQMVVVKIVCKDKTIYTEKLI